MCFDKSNMSSLLDQILSKTKILMKTVIFGPKEPADCCLLLGVIKMWFDIVLAISNGDWSILLNENLLFLSLSVGLCFCLAIGGISNDWSFQKTASPSVILSL